jgi:hypothetical protein
VKVSIVIDNYNHERFVATAIEGALAQTADDVEVIVVDDGSTDGSLEAIRHYEDRLQVVTKANGGQGTALSEGFIRSTGDVVIFLDGDDAIDAHTVERVRDVLHHHPGAARVQWPMRVIDTDGQASGEVTPRPEMMPNGDIRSHVLRHRTHVWPAQSGNAYARWALDQVMPVPDDFQIGCDLYLAETTAVLGPVHSLPEAAGSYRYHDSNTWTTGELDVAKLRQKIAWTTGSHAHVRTLCARNGVPCPEDPRAALDVAFACVRLASLRLDPTNHPLSDDRRFSLCARAVRSALVHPHHTKRHKAKRIVWILGVTFGDRRTASRLVERFYFRK